MSDREEMRQLLKKEYPEGKVQSAVPDTWKLDSTITENPSMWWPGNKCSICGGRAVYFQEKDGYRCEDHLPARVKSEGKPV